MLLSVLIKVTFFVVASGPNFSACEVAFVRNFALVPVFGDSFVGAGFRV